MKKCCGLVLFLSSMLPVSQAAVLNLSLVFSSINVTFNGVPNTSTGEVTVLLTVDTDAPDTEVSNTNAGFFATSSASLSAPTLGITNEAIVTSVFLTTGFDSLGLSFGGDSFANRKGLWNYQGFATPYTMTDPNDLNTLSVPYTGVDGGASNVQFLTTFGGGAPVTLSGGDFFDANQNSSPGSGNVVIGASIVQVPEPSSAGLLFIASGALLVFRRRAV